MREQLQAIGFDEKESEIYLALMKLGRASVNELMKNTSIERRTIYDVLERLIQKGWASYFEENNTKIYQGTKPEILLEDLEQKQNDFKKIIPQLQGLTTTPKNAKVEILKGTKGLRTIFLEIIQTGQTHYAFGDIAPLIYEEKYAKIVKKFLNEMKEKSMKEKIIYTKGDPITKVKGGEYGALEKESITPSPTLIFGNVVTQYIYTDPITIIKITSEEVAKTHIAYFEHFWKLAKK